METIEQKRLTVLNDTIGYFNTTTRNINVNDTCQYYPQHEKTEGCAVGRLIKDKELCKKLDTLGGGTRKLFKHLPAEVQELGVEFLVDLQLLHDYLYHWDQNGLTPRGKDKAEYIKTEYCS